MAISALTGSLLKFLNVAPAAISRRSSPSGLRVFVTAGTPGGPGSIEGADPQSMQSGESAGTETRGMASAAAAREAVDETIDEPESMAGNAMDRAEDLGEKAKQTMQDAWGSAKDTAQKLKETVANTTEDANDYVKEKCDVEGTIACAVQKGQQAADVVKNAAAYGPKAVDVVEKAMNTKESK